MKKTIVPVLCLAMLLSLTITVAAETKGFKKYQLMPKDDASSDKEFSLFIKNFKKDVKNKNIESLRKSITKDIVYTFDNGDGIKGFIKYWKLDRNPEKSVFWEEMEKVLSLGSSFYDEKKTSHAYPYLFVTFPEEYDSFEFSAVTGKKVNVRKDPSSESPVVETLDYEIVKPLYTDQEPRKEKIDGINGKWIQVMTSSGKEGYIFSQYLHSPIGHRAIFIKEDKSWKLSVFVSGD